MFAVRLELNFYVFVIGLNWIFCLKIKIKKKIIFTVAPTVHLDTIESSIYPTDARLDCSKNANIYIKIYMRGAPLM